MQKNTTFTTMYRNASSKVRGLLYESDVATFGVVDAVLCGGFPMSIVFLIDRFVKYP